MKKLAKTFQALSDSNRIRILKMLEVRPLCVCEITEILGLAPSTVSKHLSILRNSQFIIDRKEGKWVIYDLNFDQTQEYNRHLLPLLRTWLVNEEIILRDQQFIKTVDRSELCKS